MFTFQEITYKDILHIPSLTIPQGNITCIVGESGSGKSTLLKLMNGILSPTTGTIRFKNTPYNEIDLIELRRKVVMLSQQPILFGDTIQENLEAGVFFSNKPIPSQKDMITALQDCKLHKNLNDKADTLSVGEQQRLAFARIILMNPLVYLLDEPTSALNEELEYEVMERFTQHVHEHNKTAVYITHSQHIAKAFSDQTIDVTSFSQTGGDLVGREHN